MPLAAEAEPGGQLVLLVCPPAFVIEMNRPAVEATPEQYGLGTLIDQYWREKGARGDGAKANKSHMNHVRAFHADDTVATLTEDRQQEYEDKCLAEGAANGTINRRRGILRAALRHALRRSRITAIPIIPTLKSPIRHPSTSLATS